MKTDVVPSSPTRTRQRIPAMPVVGWLVGVDDDGRLLVDFPGNDEGPCVARSTVAVDADEVSSLVDTRRGLLLLFENADERRPIVTGVLCDAVPPAEVAPPAEAIVDGKTVQLVGQDEVSIVCGKASITLRRNGKIVVRGTFIESHSTGVHRIKGGSIRLN